jgi:hypothetical protein
MEADRDGYERTIPTITVDCHARMKQSQLKKNGIDLKQALQKQQKRYVAQKVEEEDTMKHPGEKTE